MRVTRGVLISAATARRRQGDAALHSSADYTAVIKTASVHGTTRASPQRGESVTEGRAAWKGRHHYVLRSKDVKKEGDKHA